MSRKAIDAATEITVAWVSAVGSGAVALEPEAVAEMFRTVYEKAKMLEAVPVPEAEDHVF